MDENIAGRRWKCAWCETEYTDIDPVDLYNDGSTLLCQNCFNTVGNEWLHKRSSEHHTRGFLRSHLHDLKEWLRSHNERYNPYIRIRQLQSHVEFLHNRLRHASCVCGERLCISNEDAFIECARCGQLAAASPAHDCAVYLDEGIYWCNRCAVWAARRFDIVPQNEPDDAIIESVELLPAGEFLARVRVFDRARVAGKVVGGGVTYYTVDADSWGYYVRFLDPDPLLGPCKFVGLFDDPEEASQEFQAAHGENCRYVEPVEFDALVSERGVA